jgi:DNA-directed RNA polymerase subunit RPC12/RpoP
MAFTCAGCGRTEPAMYSVCPRCGARGSFRKAEPVEMHSHRCTACGSPWPSTRATEAACPFCGEAVAS